MASLEDILGQTLIYKEITENIIHYPQKYCIFGKVGQGKHYLISKIEDFFSDSYNSIQIIHITNKKFELQQDFVPFLLQLSDMEDINSINTSFLAKNLTEIIPYIGKTITKILNQKKVYPAVFGDVEIEIIDRFERMIKNKDILFLCEEVNTWDNASLNLLNKLFIYSQELFPGNTSIICTSSIKNIMIPDQLFTKTFFLQIIPENNIQDVLQLLLPNYKLNHFIIKKIHQISNGNIGIIKELIKIIEDDGALFIKKSKIYMDITLQQLYNSLNESRLDNAVNLLNRASLIGQSSYKKLLQVFTGYDPVTFSNSVRDNAQQNILSECFEKVVFNEYYVWQAFYANNIENQTFHSELSKCIKEITPSNFSYIADELYFSGQETESAIYYALDYLNYYRKYRSIPILLPKHMMLMKKTNLYNCYCELIKLYTSYFSNNFLEVINSEIQCNDYRLRFELEFIKSTAQINVSVNLLDYKVALRMMESWIEDGAFHENSPYQWIQAAILALSIKYELHENNFSKLLKDIERTKRLFTPQDKGIQFLEFDFLSKCNFCYGIDMAYHYTSHAVTFFKENLASLPSAYPYYIALINTAANALVVGKYDKVYELSIEALNLIERNSFIQNMVDVLINNLYITLILDNKITNKDDTNLIINQLNQYLSIVNDDISKILFSNNIVVILCYSRQFDVAFEKIKLLYDSISYIKNIDDYYLYFVGSNYCILDYLVNGKPFNYELMLNLSKLQPLHHDEDYFSARNKFILDFINDEKQINLNRNDWNDFEEQHVGPAWSFWGKWILFSDIQIWSD